MRSSYSSPEYTLGTQATIPAEAENTEDRSGWQLAKDVAIDVAAKPLVGALRTGAQAWRAAEDTPGGLGETVEKGLGDVDVALAEARSPRAKALDTLSVDPKGDERSFWREPVTGAIHTMLPSVGYGLAAWATGGSSALAQIGTTVAMGAAGAGDSVNELRNYTDRTPRAELEKLPPFQKLLVDFNGNEAAARNQLFKDMIDPKSQVFNFFVQAANFPALKHGLRAPGVTKSIGARARASAYGAAEGVGLGIGESVTESYIDQLGKVRSGQQDKIDTDAMASAAASGATFGAPMAAFHAIAPPHYERKATGLDTDTTKTAGGQINQDGGPPPASAGTESWLTLPTPPGAGTPPPGAGTPPPRRPRGPVTDVEEEAPGTVPGGADQAAPNPDTITTGQPPDVSSAVSIFKTAKGSEYFLMPDGTTIRNKAPRPEHPGEQGWMEPSQRTLFITPEHANQLALVQTTSTFPKAVGVLPDGRIGVQYLAGPSKGKFERRTVGRPLDGPQVGATPLELWRNGQRFHFGNPITEVTQRPGATGAATAQAPSGPAAAAAAPTGDTTTELYNEAPAAAGPPEGPPTERVAWIQRQLQTEQNPERRAWLERQLEQEQPGQPPPMPAPLGTPRAVWSGESGFTTGVRVLDRPPVLHNGEWHQPVAYTNPHTGKTEMRLAPMRELHAAYGAETQPGAQEPPPVRTPEQPLAPEFPEVGRPGMPSPEEFGGEAQPEYRPNAPRPLDEESEKLIRGGIAPLSPNVRAELAQDLQAILNGTAMVEAGPHRIQLRSPRTPTIYDVPVEIRRTLDRAEHAALARALENDAQTAIDIIRRPPETALGQSGVLQELRARLDRQQQEEAETVANTERLRQQRVERERRGMLTEEEWRQIREPEQRQAAPPPTASQRAARRAADLLAAQKQRAEQPRRVSVSEQLKERRRLAAREARRELERAAAAEPEERPSRGERHPLLGGGELTEREAMTDRERKLADDVADYNKQIVKTTLTPEQRRELDIDRRVLEERMAAFNTSAEERGLARLELRELTLGKEQQQLKQFNDIADRMRQALGRPAEAKQLFVQLEGINTLRRRAKKRQLPYPVELYDHAVDKGWTTLPGQEQREYGRIKQETDALRAMQKAQNDRMFGRQRAARRGELRGRKGRPLAPLSERLRKVRSTAGERALSRSVDPTVDKFGVFTEAIKAQWRALPDEEKTELKRSARAKTAAAIEDIIRRLVVKYNEEARQRAREGLEPRANLLTEEQAIEAYRNSLQEKKEEQKKTAAVQSTRSGQYQAREEVIQKSLHETIAARYGTVKRFQEVLGRATELEMTVQTRQPWPGGKKRIVKLDLNRPPTAIAAQKGEDPKHARQWNEHVMELWVHAKAQQIQLAGQIKKVFLEHAIAKVERDISTHRKQAGMAEEGRSINWKLPTRMLVKETGRYLFRSGSINPNFAHYNYLANLMQLNEDIAFMQAGLGLRDAGGRRGVAQIAKHLQSYMSDRTSTPGVVRPGTLHSGRVFATGMLDELRRYTRDLTKDLELFATDAEAFLQGDMAAITERQKQRSQDTSEGYRGVSAEGMGLRGEGVVGRARDEEELRGELTTDELPRALGGEPGFQTADVEEGELPGSPYAAPADEYVPADIVERRSGERLPQAERRTDVAGRAEIAAAARQDLSRSEREAQIVGAAARDAAAGRRVVDRNGNEVMPPQATLTGRAPTWISGGRRAAEERGVNIVQDRTLADIEADLDREKREAEARLRAAGSNRTLEDIQREKREQLERDFPIKWTTPDQLRKARRGMAQISETDAEGLPVNRMPPHEEFTPYSEAEQRVLDASAQLNESLGAPEHPLIAPPETARDTIERLKSMRDKGQALDLPHDYINDDFLNMLADVAGDATVYHAPYDVVSGLGEDGPAHYNGLADRIVLSHDVSPELYARGALHESAHAATEGLLSTDSTFYNDVRSLLIRSARAADKQGVNLEKLGRDLYGLSSPSEFLAEAVANQKFREFLFKVPAPTNPVISGIKNVINALYAAIQRAWRRVTGARNADTALDVLFYDQSTVLGQTDALIKRSLKRLQREGRPAYDKAWLPPLGTEKVGGVRYLSLSAGASAFRDGLDETFARTGFAFKTMRNENQAGGLAWYTPADMTNVGSGEFRTLTRDFHRAFEEMHGTQTKMRDADKGEIAELAKIWNSWNKEGRERGGQFMIDEGMHTAWVDAPLGERDGHGKLTGKNAHIDPDALNNAQVQQEHGKLQQQLAKVIEDLPRFAEFRDRIYKFTASREQEVRANRIRDIMRLSDFVPAQLTGKPREAVIDAFEHWADTEQKMTPADQKVLRDAGVRLNDPKILEFIKDVRSEPALSKIQGPYSPFTRYGDWAITGRFKIERPKNALVLDGDINEATGQPIEDARYVFETEQEARDMVKDITEKYGLAQMSGGQMWVDTETGRRVMVEDKRRAGKERPASEREVEAMLEKGANNIEQRFYVSFQPKLLEMHPSQYVANQHMEAWQQRYGNALDISKPMDVLRHDGRQNEFYTSASMQKLINQTRASSAFQRLDQHEQAAVTREMNTAAEVYALRHGPRQRYLPRNYVKGATPHVLASLDDYSRTSSRFVAKMRHHADLRNGEEAMRQHVKDNQYQQGDRNSLAERRVAEALSRRLHNPTRDPHENVVSRGLDRFMRYTMLDKLPGIAYFMNNATEPAVLGAPLMIGRHTAWNTFSTMTGAYKLAGAVRFAAAAKHDLQQAWRPSTGKPMTDFRKLFADVVKKEPDAVGVGDLLQRAAGRNMFDASASLEYQSSFQTSRKKVDVALDWAQGIFQAINTSIENMNRFVTLVTAYRLEMRQQVKAAQKAGRELDSAAAHEAAIEYALTISHQANGIYANYNAPAMFTREGPLGMFGPVVFQFKKWPQRVIMIYARAALGTLRGFSDLARDGKMTPENKERARQLVAMLAMTGIVAGALGLPSEPFSVPVNMAFMMGLSPYNWDDAQAGFRAWAAKTFGQEGGQIVSRGPLSYLTGWDIGSRLGQENMLAFGSPASNKVRDLYASAVGLLGGASLGTASEMMQGFQKIVEGGQAKMAGADDLAYKRFGEAAKLLVPLRQFADLVGTANGMSGTELASGRKLGSPYTPWQAVGRAIGYTPTQEAEARSARSAITSAQKRVMAERNQYIQQFVQSPPGLQADRVWQTIQQQWNPSNPGQEITQSDLLKAKNTRAKAQAEPASQLGLPVDRRTRPLLPLAEHYGYR